MIESKSDFLTGTYLIARIPEDDLDRNALYTIQADCPKFILPFHYKSVNGQIELVYKVGANCKLRYFTGEFTPREYTDLWSSLLSPLLECGDWFMNPCSFLLNVDYLYYDKSKKTMCYVYIPSTRGCSGYDAFNAMAIEISKFMTVSDAVLENKVLRSIIKDFNPPDFMKMLKEYLIKPAEISKPVQIHESPRVIEAPARPTPEKTKPQQEDDIVIELAPGKTKTDEYTSRKTEKENGGYKMFSSKSKRKKSSAHNEPISIAQQKEANPGVRPEVTRFSDKQTAQEPLRSITPAAPKQAEIIDITQNLPGRANGTGLRYIGRAHLPQAIEVKIAEGEIFTIGRFDVSVGKRQSNFEFDKKTKAVSRRHAVIERDGGGYKIIDLSSSAGTFVNSQKLPPNTPYSLQTGCRVSFGNLGADYVWEVS